MLDSGGKSCRGQYGNAVNAVKSIGPDLEMEYITDSEKIMSCHVMSMSVLVVNDKVVSMGKVLKAEEGKKLLV
ncbi:MAG: thioredoxin family protein [Negativicoccus succinicivorans]|nr:thioredoxin family protein [Negativicoccus succinicivorans]